MKGILLTEREEIEW